MCEREREKLKKKLEINITDFKEGYNKKRVQTYRDYDRPRRSKIERLK